MQAEPAVALVQTGGCTSVPSAFIPSYPRASALHFLLPEQARIRRNRAMLILG